MKKLINDAADVVAESLLGVEAAHSDRVRVDHENKIIYRKGRAGRWQGRPDLGRWIRP